MYFSVKYYFIMWKNIFYFSVFILIITACSKEHTPRPDDNDPDDFTEKKYEIVSIDFDGKSVSIEELVDAKPNLTYRNNTNSVQKILVDPQPIYETSTFTPNDSESYTLIDSNKMISVPLQIDDSEISLGEKKWTYSTQEAKSLTKLNFKDSIEVEPQKYLSASLSVIYTQIQTPYTLSIKNVDTDELISIKGTWVGVYPLKTESSVNISDL